MMMKNNKTNNKIKRTIYNRYIDRIKYTVDLTNLERVYKTKYFWMKDHLKDILPKNKDVKILVLGCGIGHEVYALNKMGYKNVLGIDISKEQIEIARANGLNCICADAFEFLRNTKDKYDVILAFNFIEHFNLEEVFELCTLCYRNLTKNGILILMTPNASNPLASSMIYSDPTHEVAFTELSIKQLLTNVGFKKIIFKNIKPFGKFDNSITIMVLKLFASIIINITWKLIRLFYWINGIKSPKVVSPDLLAIAYKGDCYEDKDKK